MLKSYKFIDSLAARFKSDFGEKMAKSKNHPATDPWDQRALGAEAQFVGVADASHDVALSQALEMQAISIRLPAELIKQYKLIAGFHGIGYQPLMRDILERFVPEGLKEIVALQVQQPRRKPAIPAAGTQKAA